MKTKFACDDRCPRSHEKFSGAVNNSETKRFTRLAFPEKHNNLVKQQHIS